MTALPAFPFRILPLLLGAAVAAQTASTSVDQNKAAAYEKSVGSSKNGIVFSVEANAVFDRDSVAGSAYDRRSEIDAEAKAVVRLFGSEHTAAYVGGSVFAAREVDTVAVVGSTTYASYVCSGGGAGEVTIGGFTKWSLTDWSTSVTAQRTYDKVFGPYEVFPVAPSITFWIGPVPITLRGNAGAEASFQLTLRTNPSEPRVQASGKVSGNAYGEAELSVGIACAHATLRVVLSFGNIKVGPAITAAEGATSGSFSYELTPIELDIEVEASWCLGSATERLFHYETASISNSQTLL